MTADNRVRAVIRRFDDRIAATDHIGVVTRQPVSILASLLPVSRLLRSFPVPSIAAEPVKTRFSTFNPRPYVTELKIVSKPSFVASVTTSPV